MCDNWCKEISLEEIKRLQFEDKLWLIPGIKYVYFQPPGGMQLEYPCIVYERDGGDSKFADNKPYTFTRKYTVTAIYEDPTSNIPDYIAKSFPMCIFDRNFISDNMNHAVFGIYN